MADETIAKSPAKGTAKPLASKSVKPAAKTSQAAPAAIAAATVADVVAPKTVQAKPLAAPAPAAPKAVEPKPAAAVVPPAPVAVPTPVVAAPAAPTVEKGTTEMNETMTKVEETAKTFTADATERTSAMFGDMNAKAKDAMAKGSKAVEEMVEFSKGNVEALVASARIAAKGAEEIAKYSAEYGRKSIEEANATAKQFAGVKSPTEFFQLQSEVAKKNLDAVVAESSKFAESYLKLLGEIAQPLQNRYAVAVEKVKTTVAA